MPRNIRSLEITEHQIQCGVMEWANAAPYHLHGCYKVSDILWSTPNGGYRNIVTAVKLKKEGTKRGVPDLFSPVHNESLNARCGWFEVKKKGGVLSSEQKEMIKLLRFLGHYVSVFYSVEEGIFDIKNYLGIR